MNNNNNNNNNNKIKTFFTKYSKIIGIICCFLIGGTGQTIMPKTAYQTESEGKDGDVHYFIKPLFFNWSMFVGMTLCLLIYIGQYIIYPLILSFINKKRNIQQLNDENTNQPQIQKMPLKSYLLILACSLCDFLATYLMNFSLIVVSSSIFQMLKGSIIIFTAFLAIFYRGQKLFSFEWSSIAVICVSLVVIGAATMCPGYTEEANAALEGSTSAEGGMNIIVAMIGGIIFILIGQFLQALESVFEEQALHDISAPVTFVVGLEGLYGLIICSALMPIMQMDWVPDELYEDTKDTFIMLGKNSQLCWIVVVNIVFVFIHNLFGMMITSEGNAMLRNVVEPMKMITIWITSVFLYYAVDDSIGEKVGLFTILEVLGFLLLSFGFVVYTRIVKFPKLFNYPAKNILDHDNDDDNNNNGNDEENKIQNEINDSKPLLEDLN